MRLRLAGEGAPKGFVGGDGNGVGKVDGAGVGTGHGENGELMGILDVIGFGKSGGFTSKDKCAAGVERGVVEGFSSLSAEKTELRWMAVDQIILKGVVEVKV